MKEDWKDNLDIIDLDPTGTMPTIPVLPAEDDILSGHKDKEEEKPDGEKVTESASPEEELSGTEAGEEADPETVQAGEEYVPDEVQSAEEQAPEELQPGEEEISGRRSRKKSRLRKKTMKKNRYTGSVTIVRRRMIFR